MKNTKTKRMLAVAALLAVGVIVYGYVNDRRAKQMQAEVMEEVSEDEEELNIMRERLNVFVDSLPEKCREIFILACIEGLKYKEVAERLDVSVNTVKTQLKSAYSKLRTEFNEKDLEIIALLIFLGYM